MGKYFTIAELCKSETADRLHINNQPTIEQKAHLEELIEVLDKIREALGKPMVITSGLRQPALNQAVGGSKTSGHLTGYSADIQVRGMTAAELAYFIQGFLSGNKIGWHQIIIEKKGLTQ